MPGWIAAAFAYRSATPLWLGGDRPITPVNPQRLASVCALQMFQHGVAGFLGVSERLERRAADRDGATALIERAPRRHIAGVSVKAGTGGALIADHERKAVAVRAPYFHVLDGAVELQGHQQLFTCSWKHVLSALNGRAWQELAPKMGL